MSEQQNHTISKAFESYTTYLCYNGKDGIHILEAILQEADNKSLSAEALFKAALAQHVLLPDGRIAFASKHLDRLRSLYNQRRKGGEASEELRTAAGIASKASVGAITGEEVRAIKLQAARLQVSLEIIVDPLGEGK